MMRRVSACLFVLFAFAFLRVDVRAQDPSKAVTARGVISSDKVRQGGSFQVAVVLDIGPTFHINSSHPSDPNLIPTKIEPAKIDGVTYGAIAYPKGENQKFKFSEEPLSVYSERVVIKIPASATAKLPLGQQTLRTKLSYQACNDQACFAPKTIEVAIPVEVVEAGAKVSPANADIFGAAKPAGKSAAAGKRKGK